MTTKYKPIDLGNLSTYSLADRNSKVTAEAFARPWRPGGSFADFLASFPKILAAETIERMDPYMGQIVNRFRAASMMIEDETRYILECVPAGYAGYAGLPVEPESRVCRRTISLRRLENK